MYVGLLTAVFRRGRIHHALCAYLATYAVFAGICVMAYPGDIFTATVGINIQTAVCHGSMISVGLYLWYSGYVKLDKSTFFGALSVFAAALGVAMCLNELMYHSGIIGEETFNMFFVSLHFPPYLPVYSSVQGKVPFPMDILIYLAGFTAAAVVVMLLAEGIKRGLTAVSSSFKKKHSEN